MNFQTADLYDDHSEKLSVVSPGYMMTGQKACFGGAIVTVKCHEDNSLVRETLGTDGNGKVLVIDGGGSMRCALVGDRLAQKAIDNGWEGIVVNGCIRDSMLIDEMAIGVKMLNTNPAKSIKRGVGLLNEIVHFSGVTFKPDAYLYADHDGIVVCNEKLV